jgi:hypothetical protein
MSMLALLAFALSLDLPCQAGLVIESQSVTATPGSSGSFDILIMNTNSPGGSSFDVASDFVGLSLTGLPGVEFTGVSITTTSAPYIYVLSGTTQGGGPFSFDNFPTTQFLASDSEFGPLGFRAIDPGDTFGLANVTYTVASSAAAGAGTLTITSDTSLADANGANVAFTPMNGVFTVSTIPEPSSVISLAIGCASVVFGSAKRRSHARSKR